MPHPVLIRITHKGNQLTGPTNAFGVNGVWEGHEFSHRVRGWDEFSGFSYEWQRAHRDASVTMAIGSCLPELYTALSRGEALDKVELLWPRYSEQGHTEGVYFTTVLYPVKVSGIALVCPNVKDRRYSRYNHLVRLNLRYRWIEWEYTRGKLWYKDEWIEYIMETFHVKDERERGELEQMLSQPAETDELYDQMMAAEKRKKIKLVYPTFEHADETRRKDSPHEAAEGDTVRLSYQTKALNDGSDVTFRLYDASGETPFCFAELAGKNRNQVASTEWTVDFSKCRSPTPKIEFEAESKEKKAIERGNVPVVYTAPRDRWIIFEEATRFVEVVEHYERWEPGPAKERWIYVFGALDGRQYKDVWEIRTDANGKFATYKLTADNYDNRPASESFEDVAFLPANDDSGTKYAFLVALSDIRLPVERIFDGKTGLTSGPEKRCLNIDDDQQVARKTDDTGEEHVILINYLHRAEQLRADFDRVREEWEALRLPSSAETSEERKKQKLLMEFGALINTVLEAFPKYRKQLSDEGYQRLQSDLQQYETEKAKKTGEVGGKVLLLCDWIDTEKFAETCRDYLALIAEGEDQSREWYDFEERIGNLLDGLSRFPRGQETLGSLLKKTSSAEENSWLQALLLFNNDAWSSDGEQLFDEDVAVSPANTYNRIREFSDGTVKLLREAALSGAGTYKPQEMAAIIQRVLRTTGGSFQIELAETMARGRPEVRPFADVLDDFSETSFWRFSFDKSISYDNAAARFITSKGLDKMLVALEGVSVAFALKEFLDKKPKNGKETIERYNNLAAIVSFFAENLSLIPYRGKLVRLGTGPIQVVNLATSLVDGVLALFESQKEIDSHDIDSAVWNMVAAGGFFVAATGSGALVATFFAGAAGLSATGIGIAPGLVLAVIGTVIAIGSKTMADLANNSQMEDLLLKTPWGTHAEFSSTQAPFSKVNSQYVKAVQILNTFSIDLNVDKQTAEIELRRLEPESKITLNEVVFATSASDKLATNGSVKYEERTVGKDIPLNAANTTVTKTQQATSVTVDLSKICGIESDTYWMANRPDFIRVLVQIDLIGDKEVLLPDKGKCVTAHCYSGQKTECKVL